MWLLAGMLLFSVHLGHFQEESLPSGAIHLLAKRMDPRVKPSGDDVL
jgi:hypothetical protein